MALAIETTGLGLVLGGRAILSDVSLQVRRGEVFGVLGPNGAGKTTTVRVLAGLLRATSGQARVLGLDPADPAVGQEIRRRCGVLTEGPALYEHLSGRANLAFFAALHGLDPAQPHVEEALDAVGLTDRAAERVGTYSKGMQQRLAIARAILHQPELLFLDEPTAGLDPASSARVATLIASYRAKGHTVFLATHHLLDAERQCDRFAFYAGGRLLALGARDELEALAGLSPGVALTFAGAAPPPPSGLAVKLTPTGWHVTLPELAATPAIVAAAVAAGGQILAVEPQRASLEDLYFALVEGR